MHGRRTALRYSPSTPSPASGARAVRAQSYPSGAGGPLHRRHGECLAGGACACVAACNQRPQGTRHFRTCIFKVRVRPLQLY